MSNLLIIIIHWNGKNASVFVKNIINRRLAEGTAAAFVYSSLKPTKLYFSILSSYTDGSV